MVSGVLLVRQADEEMNKSKSSAVRIALAITTFLLAGVLAHSMEVTTEWSAPVFREDGAALQSSEIEEYRLYSGAPGSYELLAQVTGTEYQLTVAEGECYLLSLTAVDTLDVESEHSSAFNICNTNTNAQDKVDWPAGTDENLPYAGIFYGIDEGSNNFGNTPISNYETSRSYVALRSGLVVSARFKIRQLTQGNIDYQCGLGQQAYCDCITASLTPGQCGHTLSAPYYVGNGGSQRAEIRGDDGTPLHRPSSVVLAKATQAIVPSDELADSFVRVDFANPVYLRAGEIYHFVIKNENPTSCSLTELTTTQAKLCPNNSGAIALDGSSYSSPLANRGPRIGLHERSWRRDGPANVWVENATVMPWVVFEYIDSLVVGDSHTGYNAYASYPNSSSGGRRDISGANWARQKFTVNDTTRQVDGMWLYAERPTDTVNGANLSVRVKSDGGSTLATGTILASDVPNNYTNVSGTNMPLRYWAYTDLSSTVTLTQGQTYTVEFSSPIGSGWSISTAFPMNYGNYQIFARRQWDNAQAEASTDSGATWGGFSGTFYPDRDISVMFTIVGMPKQLTTTTDSVGNLPPIKPIDFTVDPNAN